MTPRFRVLVLACAPFLALTACSDARAADGAATERPASAPSGLENAPVARWQADLLELAFDTASAMPAFPHLKNRSKAQEAVVTAALELEQPRRALDFVESIEGWRRGSGYADVAEHLARHGAGEAAEPYLARAQEIADQAIDAAAEEEAPGMRAQDWQIDLIRSKVARARLVLGQAEAAQALEASLVASEAGRVGAERARRADDADFEHWLENAREAAATGDFNLMQNALAICVQLHDRFYAQVERRDLALETLHGFWEHLPVQVRVEAQMDLGRSALAHQDAPRALALAREAEDLIEAGEWLPEDRIPLVARVAILRSSAGDRAGARASVDAALALFDASRARIVDIYRAGVLRPLGEAFMALGDATAARSAYRRAVEAGFENPNARPRAEDLSATACSMAVHGVEPDANLWARMRLIRGALREPW